MTESHRIKHIHALGDDSYAVTVVTPAGIERQLTCRVITDGGITALSINPDIVTSDHPPEINSREFVGEVLRFHREHTNQ